MSHDDGQGLDGLEGADVVLVGVSRTSKTPTCVYLAHRGIKAANVPIVTEDLGRTRRSGQPAAPADRRAHDQRRTARTSATPASGCSVSSRATATCMAATTQTSSGSAANWSRPPVARHQWPELDVTKRSVEETAAAIYQMVKARQQPELKALAAVLPSPGWSGDGP